MYWWWVHNPNWPGGPFLKSTFSSRPRPAKYLQQYDRDNGCKVGKLNKQRVTVDATK